MDARMLKRFFQAATVGTSMLSCLTSFAGDHRIFPDEPQRPHVSAACQPNWGFNQTCWQRFPQLPPCDGQGSCLNGQCETNSMYVPQTLQPHMINPQALQPQIMNPQIMNPQVPQSYPETPADMHPPMSQMPSMMSHPMDSGTQWSTPPAMQQFTLPVPVVPDQNMRYSEPQSSNVPMMQAPGAVPALPPLPEPAPGMNVPHSQVPAIPNQTNAGPRPRDYRTIRPVQITPASRVIAPENASRYGQPSASTAPVMTPLRAADNNTARLVASSRREQSATSTPVQSPPNANQKPSAMRYTSGTPTVPVAPATSTRYSGKSKSQPNAAQIPIRTSSQSRPLPTQPLPESSRYGQRR